MTPAWRARVLPPTPTAVAIASAWNSATPGNTQLGYASQSAFSATFRKTFGSTPEFNVFSGSVNGFSIGADPETSEAFDSQLAKLEAEIRAKPDWFEGNKNLELVREVKTDNGLRGEDIHARTQGIRRVAVEWR